MTIPALQLINGQLVPAESGETFPCLNPFDQSLVGHAPKSGEADIQKAVTAARKAFDEGPWSRMSGSERSAAMMRLVDIIDSDRKKALSATLVAESGSTIRKAKGEVAISLKQLAYFAELAQRDLTEEIQELSRAGVSRNLLVREPIGVCGQIIPWNFPISMLIWKLGPALAAGNTVVLKVAEETPISALMMAQWMAEADLPPGVLNIVTGFGPEAGAPLSMHPEVDKVAFTGSTEIGKCIMANAAGTMKRVTLECGGKSANIVLDDADLDMAVDGSLYAAFFHSGQCCEAGTRLFLQRGIYERFMESFVSKTKRIRLGNPADPATDMGPVISQKQQQRILSYIQQGKDAGAHLVTGGGIPTDPALAQGWFIEPTLFDQVDNSMAIAQEEIFGPVISIIPFNTLDEVAKMANASIYGLGGAVWSQDVDKAMRLARQLRTGTVWVNEYHLISEKAPFGGFKQSGLGRELGLEGLKAYTEVKHIYIDELGDRAKKVWYDSVLAPQPSPTAS